MNKAKIIFQIIATLLLCMLVEGICWFVLQSRQEYVGFLFNLNSSKSFNTTKKSIYTEIDPLCGWEISNRKLKGMGFDIEQNCVVLKSNGDYPVEPFKIFITGGSCSDVVLYKDNWPNKLNDIFIKEKINTITYVAATGGYSSAQELLRLLSDGLQLKPDVHISYSGVNEGDDGRYVTDYEQEIFEGIFRQSGTSPILPSTVYLIKKVFQLNYTGLSLKPRNLYSSSNFWIQNERAMKGIALENDYKFIGILQPALGIGNYRYNGEEANDWRANFYRQYFPACKAYVLKQDSLCDFTGIFDTATGKVYIDDCHLTKEYQPAIAQKIFMILRERKILKQIIKLI